MDRLQRLLDPHFFPAFVLGGLLLLFLLAVRGRRRSRQVAGGLLLVLALALIGLAVLGAALGEPDWRHFALHPERLPIVLWSAAACFMVGWALWRWSPQEDAAPQRLASPYTWSGMTTGERGVVLALALGLIALAVGIGAPLGPPADAAWAPAPVKAPWFLIGLQELAICFAPWMVRWLIPAAIVLGLVALPYLDGGRSHAAEAPFPGRPPAMALFLLAAAVLWVAPLLIGGLLRGPGGEVSGLLVGTRTGAPHGVGLVSWSAGMRGLLGMSPPQSLLLRELPGLLLALFYFAALPWVLAHWHPTRPLLLTARAHLGAARYGLALGLALFVVFVPLRLFGCWLLGLGDLIHLPELGLRF